MEIEDGNEKALDLRAPENNVPKPTLKKEMSKARPDYMKLMVTDVNHKGYTPLMVACEQYATVNVSSVVMTRHISHTYLSS